MSSLDNLRWRFRDQFTPTDGGYLYRRGSRGPALPVSTSDRDAFVDEFDRALRRLQWSGILSAALLFAAAAWFQHAGPAFLGRYAFLGAAVLFFIAWGSLTWAAWNRPHRLLDGRAPVAGRLSGREVRANGLRTLPWRVLILGMGLAIALAVRVAFEPWSPASRSYYALAAVLFALVAGMAVAKSRRR